MDHCSYIEQKIKIALHKEQPIQKVVDTIARFRVTASLKEMNNEKRNYTA